MSVIPSGYRLCQRQKGFSAALGPFYEKPLSGDDRSLLRAMRVQDWHCNPEGYVHGGVLASFADFAMYQAAGDCLGMDSQTPTVTMTCNYLAGAQRGDWLTAQARITRRSRSLLFIGVELKLAQQTVLEASGVYKIVR